MRTKVAHIILGLGYGDEGKGMVADYYCSQTNNDAIVIRFNGGQQAGHTVFTNPKNKHVFSNFGSGTHRGIPTYWSKFCSFSPGFFLDEWKTLERKSIFYLDNECPITTHYDILYNKLIEQFRGKKRFSSCGLGVGPTFERSKFSRYRILAGDLLNPEILIKKLFIIREYYKKKIQQETNYLFFAFDHDEEDSNFLKIVEQIRSLFIQGCVLLTNENEILTPKSEWNYYIFEGAQGILLDKKFGIKPYVTQSNTTSRNAINLINKHFEKDLVQVSISYVTRAYLTRHGNGPFNIAKPKLRLKNTCHETNQYNHYQGKFRIGLLDFNLLNYAISCDQTFSNTYQRNFFITCLDQLDFQSIPVLIDGKRKRISFEMIQAFMCYDFRSVFYSFSPFSHEVYKT